MGIRHHRDADEPVHGYHLLLERLQEASTDVFRSRRDRELVALHPFLRAFGLMMPFSGKLMDKYGPKKVALFGGVLVGVGWLLGSQSTNMMMLSATYGVLGGIGVGFAYNSPIGVSGRWFPDKRGLAVGLSYGLWNLTVSYSTLS